MRGEWSKGKWGVGFWLVLWILLRRGKDCRFGDGRMRYLVGFLYIESECRRWGKEGKSTSTHKSE